MKRHHNAVSIEGIEEDNLFNRASDRMHGYSSRVARFLRLSISLRSSASYSALLLRMLIPLALVLTITYGIIQAPNYIERQRQALEQLPESGVAGVDVVMLDPSEPLEGVILYDGWGLRVDTNPLYVRLLYAQVHEGQTAQLLFSLEEDWRVMRGLYTGLAVMLLLIILNFMSKRQRLNRSLLRPIQDITETAQQMNEKNLSARINVAGTQNELRDLAVVINDMLDRIEVAYNRQKQFVSDASHELRTPIAVIQGYAGLLDRWGKDNPDVRDEAIGAISTETQSMKELVENLLFLARHDKKTLSLSYEPFDSADMLRELVKETQIIAREHHVLAGQVAELTIVADRASIKQAVRVFVDNAIKYTPPGGSVEISSLLREGCLHITVSDSGPGIKRADLERIFDRFFRSDEARNGQSGGHGLGLSIARIIAASHGGRIHAKSKRGMGSAFTLEVPVRPAPAAPSAEKKAYEEGGPAQ